jgi:hypothetical protein
LVSTFYVAWIPGLMCGVEWDYVDKFLVLDLFIIRLVWDYGWTFEGEKKNA